MCFCIFLFHFAISNQMLASANIALSQTPQGENSDVRTQDEITVVGVRTGPRMWRVVKGDSELFVLVTVDYVPEDFEWNATHVNRVLEEAKEVLTAPRSELSTGNRTRLLGTLLRTFIFNRGRIVMPKKTIMSDKIGEELAERFLFTQAKVETRLDARKERLKLERKKQKTAKRNKNDDGWLKDNEFSEIADASYDNEDQGKLNEKLTDVEPGRFYPYIQAQNLVSDSIRGAGLQDFSIIESQIKKSSKKVKTKPRPKTRAILELDFAFRDIKKIIKNIRKFSDETNRLCVTAAIDFVDNELDQHYQLADAWAHGDVQYLRQHSMDRTTSECNNAISDELGGLKTLGGQTVAEFDFIQLWVDEVSAIMEEPGVRIALIPARSWLREGAAMDRLIALGLDVRGP